MNLEAEGWFVDPFGLHEARWFSNGTPTALVRDGRKEGHEAPPTKKYVGPLSRISSPDDPHDLRRADDAESAAPDGFVAFETFGETYTAYTGE
jgi:hypothetical protein